MRRISAAIAVCALFSSAGCFLALGFGDYDRSDPEQTGDSGGNGDGGGGEGGGGSAFFTTSPAEVVLMPGTSANVEAKLQRKDGFMGVVRLSATGLPPGVSTNANGLVISATASAATITLTATPDARHTRATIDVRAETDGKTFDAKIGLLLRGPPGSVDTSFGTNGITNIEFEAPAMLSQLRLLGDDRILLGGDVTETQSSFAIARLEAGGALDKTLAGKGTLTTKPGISAGVTGLGLGTTGFVAAGAGVGGVAVARYRDDGSFEPTFNGGSPLVLGTSFTVAGVFPKASGGLAIAGDDGFRPSVLHVTAGATVDNAIGDGGIVSSTTTGGSLGATIAADGTIVTAGSSSRSGCGLFDFAGFGTTFSGNIEDVPSCNGLVDVTVGDGGTKAATGSAIGAQFTTLFVAYRKFPSDKVRGIISLGQGSGRGVAIDSADRLLVVGDPSASDRKRFYVVRILPDDSIDPTFVLAQTPIGTDMSAQRVALQRDGRIIVAGTSSPTAGKSTTFTVVRYWP